MFTRRKIIAGLLATPLVPHLGQGTDIIETPRALSSVPTAHPFVFATQTDLRKFVESKNKSCVAARAHLEAKVRRALGNSTKYTAAYSGCTLERYLRDLTYEYGGAAQVAADLATYAYLANFRTDYGDVVLASKAKDTAREILIRWSSEGFRDGNLLRADIEQFCNQQGISDQETRFAIGLQVGRGMPYWVHAQDILVGLEALDRNETEMLDKFLVGMFQLIRSAANYRALQSKLDCNRFSNHVSGQLVGLLAIARLRVDRPNLEDLAFGTLNQIAIPWTVQVDHAIYHANGKPVNCFPINSYPAYFQIDPAQRGEIIDRFRAGDRQTFGYPMLSLTFLLMSAHILNSSGFQADDTIKNRSNRLQLAIDYYGGYFLRLLSPTETRVPPNLNYPGSRQYEGKLISSANGSTIDGSDSLILPFILARRVFPENWTARQVLNKANSFSPQFETGSAVGSIFYSSLVA